MIALETLNLITFFLNYAQINHDQEITYIECFYIKHQLIFERAKKHFVKLLIQLYLVVNCT